MIKTNTILIFTERERERERELILYQSYILAKKKKVNYTTLRFIALIPPSNIFIMTFYSLKFL